MKIDNKAIRLLIFDLDGTLADTIWSIRDGVNMAMRKYGYPERSYVEVRDAIGNGARELIRRSMPKEYINDSNLVDRVFHDYDAFYGETYANCDRCYDGMLEALLYLQQRGYTIAVLSNKQDTYVKALTKKLLPEGMAKISMGQTSLPRKPDPTVPLMIAKELGYGAGETAFIGDSEVDVLTAQNARMYSVGCSWGYRGREVLQDAGSDIIIDSPSELVEIFR